MKLSTAIRRGAKLVKFQTKGTWVRYDKKKGGVCGCAMGAAYLALYPEELALVEKRKSAQGVNARAHEWARINGQGQARTAVEVANDADGLDFSQITNALVRREPLGGFGYTGNPEVEKVPLDELKRRVDEGKRRKW